MMKNIILTVLVCTMAFIAMAQTDVTNRYIKNPSFEAGFGDWTSSSLQSQSNNDFPMKSGSMYVEKWVSSVSTVGNASISQALTKLPAGRYQLTVGAQNLSQSSPSTQCAGAYIYAGDSTTNVYTPADYSVTFTTMSGEVEIGFKAVNARGNWLAVDNFRLYRIGEISNEELLKTLAEEIHIADSLLELEMAEKIKSALQVAAETARTLNVESEQSAIQSALTTLITLNEKARFAVLLQSATPGSGTAPRVSSTNHYVPTGATQALMRATSTGSNVQERGVCWSEDHNPTVLDERTTKYFSLNGNIYHITGLKPATVYYLRPYVLNKTYTVAYGDEVKIVTHPAGTCRGTWDNGAPNDAANARCSVAIAQTIDYFNEWTGIKGFTLSGHYGSGTATADCSYGGWMRIGPNASNQAIGTVIHETGHGVGVGTSSRWWDTNFHDVRWKGREANTMLQFLENKAGDANCYMRGDSLHAWGQSATYDWFVNGADKDTHSELQYLGGCCLLYAFFVDGLCPTSAYTNGLAGYTYNFDDSTKYYLMCKDAALGLGTGVVRVKNASGFIRLGIENCLNDHDTVPADAAWNIEFNAQTGRYMFRSAVDGKYMTHSSGTSLQTKALANPSEKEEFQLMPDRTDVVLTATDGSKITTHGFWLTWTDSGKNKSFTAPNSQTGNITGAEYSPLDSATKQHWIILSEEELTRLKPEVTGIEQIYSEATVNETSVQMYYNLSGQRVLAPTRGLYIVNGNKTLLK